MFRIKYKPTRSWRKCGCCFDQQLYLNLWCPSNLIILNQNLKSANQICGKHNKSHGQQKAKIGKIATHSFSHDKIFKPRERATILKSALSCNLRLVSDTSGLTNTTHLIQNAYHWQKILFTNVSRQRFRNIKGVLLFRNIWFLKAPSIDRHRKWR